MSHIIVIYKCKIIFVHRYISDISDFCYINKFIRLMIYQNFLMIYRWYISSMFDYFNNFKYQRYISDISVIYQLYIIWYFVRIHMVTNDTGISTECITFIFWYIMFTVNQREKKVGVNHCMCVGGGGINPTNSVDISCFLYDEKNNLQFPMRRHRELFPYYII